MSEDLHNPDGSPPSFVPADERAAWWERKAKRAEAKSTKLLEALKMIADCYALGASVGMKLEAANAIAEYEANRD